MIDQFDNSGNLAIKFNHSYFDGVRAWLFLITSIGSDTKLRGDQPAACFLLLTCLHKMVAVNCFWTVASQMVMGHQLNEKLGHLSVSSTCEKSVEAVIDYEGDEESYK